MVTKAGFLCLACAVMMLTSAAQAIVFVAAPTEPTMTVAYSTTVADYDATHPGNELLITYNITNSSEPGDINNMINWTLSAGTDNGIYKILIGTGMTGWSKTISSDMVFLDGTGLPLVPGTTGRVQVFSTNTQTTTGYANATAFGNIAGRIPFNQVEVAVPFQYLAIDVNQDGKINDYDLAEFLSCGTGPAIPIVPGGTSTHGYDCQVFDLTLDGSIAQDDFGLLQVCLSDDNQYDARCLER